MTEPARQLLDEVLRLPTHELANFVDMLIVRMHDAPDPDVEEAWAVEIERRARRVLAGESEGEDWEVVRERVRTKLRR